MKVTIWGSRGSTPVNGPQFAKYSGETACIEVQTDFGDTILLDAGTGLRAYALAKKRELEKIDPVICISHLHLDHIQGLPFYPPLFNKNVKIYGPQFSNDATFSQNLSRLFDGVLFPIRWENLEKARAEGVYPNSCFKIGSALIELVPTNHPGGNLAWKIQADGQCLVYTGDHEIPLDSSEKEKTEIHEKLLEFMNGADLAIVDSQYSREDHEKCKGWGHSDFKQWRDVLAGMNIKTVVYTHFSPDYNDADIDELLEENSSKQAGLKNLAAYPGLQIDLRKKEIQSENTNNVIYDFLGKISHLSDSYAILDALLSEARSLSNADAGTIYIVKNGELVFSASQNDTLFPASAANKYAYMNARLPIDRSSITGYVAKTGKSLNIDDVYALDDKLQYSFNDSFDRKTGYRTRSMLSVPLLNGQNRVVGVLQVINAKENGEITAFNHQRAFLVSQIANISTLPLEKAFLIVDIIMRMLQTSALRDPTETTAHVQRVGNVAAELYQAWANASHKEPGEIIANKSRLRLAAMLHDIGKVGIPDGILKKPGKLTDDERKIMQTHAALGAGLFKNINNELEQMTRDIALHHHARWDGCGYTGSDKILTLQGENIPIWARIVAIADVYDALVSKRCYKEGWNSEKAMSILKSEAGSHFDPRLIEQFAHLQDIISAIYRRYDE